MRFLIVFLNSKGSWPISWEVLLLDKSTSVSHVVPSEVRRGCWTRRNWSHRWLGDAVRVLRTRPWYTSRTSTLKAIFPAITHLLFREGPQVSLETQLHHTNNISTHEFHNFSQLNFYHLLFNIWFHVESWVYHLFKN